MHVSPAQLRGARAMLGWSMLELANASGVSIVAVRLAERGDPERVTGAAGAICSAFEAAGIRFRDHDVSSECVSLGERRD